MLIKKISNSVLACLFVFIVVLCFALLYHYRSNKVITKSDISKIELMTREIPLCADSIEIYFSDKFVNKGIKFVAVNINSRTIVHEGWLKTAKDSTIMPGEYEISETGQVIEVLSHGRIAIRREDNSVWGKIRGN